MCIVPSTVNPSLTPRVKIHTIKMQAATFHVWYKCLYLVGLWYVGLVLRESKVEGESSGRGNVVEVGRSYHGAGFGRFIAGSL